MTKWLLACLLACLVALPALAAEQVDINTATAEQIAETLTGVGLNKAQKIVEYRESNGPFVHIDELVNVKGIGLRTVDKNRDAILLGTQKPSEE